MGTEVGGWGGVWGWGRSAKPERRVMDIKLEKD